MDNKFRNVGDPLDCLAEECAELIKIIMKVRRFGLKSHHPDDDEDVTNEISLLYKMRDVEYRIDNVRNTVCTGLVDSDGNSDDQKQDLARLQKIRKFVQRYKELDAEVRNTSNPPAKDALQRRRDDVGTTIENIVWGL